MDKQGGEVARLRLDFRVAAIQHIVIVNVGLAVAAATPIKNEHRMRRQVRRLTAKVVCGASLARLAAVSADLLRRLRTTEVKKEKVECCRRGGEEGGGDARLRILGEG